MINLTTYGHLNLIKYMHVLIIGTPLYDQTSCRPPRGWLTSFSMNLLRENRKMSPVMLPMEVVGKTSTRCDHGLLALQRS